MQNRRQLFIVLLMLFALTATARVCLAVPTQFGDSGLISEPTAETLNSGNICVGILANCAENDGKTATILPVFMTLGLGSFLEAYGSYPNVLFNENEEASGRGYSNVGFKIRVLGKRSSQFKLGFDGQLRRTVSSNINYDGLTDQVYRAIASYNNGTFGIHGNAGYVKPESPQYISYDNRMLYGGGVEYLPSSRLRLLTEVGIESSKSQALSDRAEVTAGFQYFLSPHLTLNLALVKGFSDESPDWRALFGFSSCQGIGTYQRPIPRKVAPKEELVEETVEKKVLKVRTLTPLKPKKRVAEPDKSSSLYEVPVGEAAEVVTLSPTLEVSDVNNIALAGGAVKTAAATTPLAISSGIPLLQVAPEMAGSLAVTALALPVTDAIIPSPQRPARAYKLNDVVKTDENQSVGKKIVDDPRYAAHFYSIAETPTNFTAVFFHKFEKPLDIWVEGPGKTRAQLSKSRALPYEEITLVVAKVNGKIPYFKLHLGEFSEVFEFFPLRKSIKLGKVEINVKAVDTDGSSALTDPSVVAEGLPAAVPAGAVTPIATIAAVATLSVNSPVPTGVELRDEARVTAATEATDSPAVSETPDVVVVIPTENTTKAPPPVATSPVADGVSQLKTEIALVPAEIPAVEIRISRSPETGSSAPIPAKTIQAVAHKKFRLPSTVIFAFDDATLTDEGKAAITDVVATITTEKNWYVLRVDGFTDSLGSDDYNIKLGMRRAIAVASYMVTNNGIDPAIVFVKSSGENEPIATNETEEGRSLNRRAEIVLFVQKEE